MNVFEQDKQYVASTYKRFDVNIVSGKGSVFTDVNGKEYIDMGSGIGVTSFGACDDIWKNAVTEQLGKIQHTSNLYYTEPCAKLAQLLCEKTGMKKVFFGNSGAEANECAIKAARKYSADKKGKNFYTIATLKNSFHGRTLTTLAATGQDHYHELFCPLTPGFVHFEAGNIYELQALGAEVGLAGVMMEMIQGEGGVITLDKQFVKDVAAYCNKHDIPLIIDEVQTGNGRTGKMYAYMNYDIKPDIVSTAKGLGGGLPIGACLLGEKVENVFTYGDHGSTFGGNPVSCAGAVSIVERLDDAFLAEVAKKGEMITKAFEGVKGVKSISGIGMMKGIETEKKAADVVARCIEKGVLCLTAKEKIRLLPALNIPCETLEKALNIIKEVIAE